MGRLVTWVLLFGGCTSGGGGGDGDADMDADVDADADTDADTDSDGGTTISGQLTDGGTTATLPLTCSVRLFAAAGALTDATLYQTPATVGAWPQDYELDDFAGPRDGYVGAICDTNGDGAVDATDTAGGWYGTPATQVSEPATGIDIPIADLM